MSSVIYIARCIRTVMGFPPDVRPSRAWSTPSHRVQPSRLALGETPGRFWGFSPVALRPSGRESRCHKRHSTLLKPLQRAAPRRLKILVVEDDAAACNALVELLRALGHLVIGARTAAQVLDLVVRQGVRPEVLLADLVLPDLLAPDLVARLAADSPRTRVIYMTGYPEAWLRRFGLTAEDLDVVPKPLDLSILRTLLGAGPSLTPRAEGGGRGPGARRRSGPAGPG